jgi:putative ABC transport system permease protein
LTNKQLARNKTFSLINITGLSIGIVSILGTSLYLIDELSYDRFHRNSDRIYRAINTKTNSDGQISKWGAVPRKLAPTSAKEISEVEKVTGVFHHNFGDIGFVPNEYFSETKLLYAEPQIFDVFTSPLVEGTPGS